MIGPSEIAKYVDSLNFRLYLFYSDNARPRLAGVDRERRRMTDRGDPSKIRGRDERARSGPAGPAL